MEEHCMVFKVGFYRYLRIKKGSSENQITRGGTLFGIKCIFLRLSKDQKRLLREPNNPRWNIVCYYRQVIQDING
jgi:hypothetical protein